MTSHAISQTSRSLDLDTPVLTTDRLVLRPPGRDDIDDLVTIANDRDIAAMTSRLPHPYERTHGENFICAIEDGTASGHIFAVTLAKTGHLIGMCGVEMRARSNGLEVGYWIGKRWWGHGYATEASKAAVDLSFKVTGTDEIFATCQRDNAASRQVLLKQGFRFVGLDEVETVASGLVSVERYRVTRSDWLFHALNANSDAA